MFRAIRYLFLAVLILVLVTLAMSNREVVTLSLLTSEVEAFVGFNLHLPVPLFFVFFGGMVLGLASASSGNICASIASARPPARRQNRPRRWSANWVG